MNEIEIIESLYGEEKYEAVESKEFDGNTYLGWYIHGYKTIEDLKKDFPTEFDIINLYNTQAM